jgi:hypothetical protein
MGQAINMIYFVRKELAAPAQLQLPSGHHAIRTLQVPAGQSATVTAPPGARRSASAFIVRTAS